MMGNYQVRFRGRGTGGPLWIAWPLPDEPSGDEADNRRV